MELERSNKEHAEDSARLKAEAFNLRMQLEQTFRKSLQEMDVKYQEQAFAEMDKESKNALLANSKLEEELAIQSIGIESLLKKYKEQEKSLQQLRLSKAILEKKQKLQMQQISGLKREAMEGEARIGNMQHGLQQMHNQNLQREQQDAQAVRLKEETAKAILELEKERMRSNKWKNRAVDISQKMILQKQAFESAFVAPHSRSVSRPDSVVSGYEQDEYVDINAMWSSKGGNAVTVPAGRTAPVSISSLPMPNKSSMARSKSAVGLPKSSLGRSYTKSVPSNVGMYSSSSSSRVPPVRKVSRGNILRNGMGKFGP